MSKNFFDVNDRTLGPSDVHRKDKEELYETAFNKDQKTILDDMEGGSSLPEVTEDDNGKVLTVVEGAWDKADVPNELPVVTSTDNGKVLTVVEGAWNKASGGGGDAEVWLTGDTGVEAQGLMQFVLSNVDDVDHISELYNNGENYTVYLNGVELPYLVYEESDPTWYDSETQESVTKGVTIYEAQGTKYATAVYLDASTAPTSVEVSVKAK